MEFNVGDVVRLKSGSPDMTICEYPIKIVDGSTNCQSAKCQWFDKDGKLSNATFNVDVLEKIEKK